MSVLTIVSEIHLVHPFSNAASTSTLRVKGGPLAGSLLLSPIDMSPAAFTFTSPAPAGNTVASHPSHGTYAFGTSIPASGLQHTHSPIPFNHPPAAFTPASGLQRSPTHLNYPPTLQNHSQAPSRPTLLNPSSSLTESEYQAILRSPSPDLPAAPTTELTNLFVDACANEFGFGEAESELRQNLHGFFDVSVAKNYNPDLLIILIKLGKNLHKGDLGTRVYTLASIFNIIKQQREALAATNGMVSMMRDAFVRLEGNFTLTKDQKVCHLSFNANTY
jgi:hypothetical protein